MENYKEKIAAILTRLADYYGRTLTPGQLDDYSEDLLDLEPDQIVQAIKIYKRDPKSERFPLPAALRAIIIKPVNSDQAAIDNMEKIWAAIGKFGWPNEANAKNYLGEYLSSFIDHYGGWVNL